MAKTVGFSCSIKLQWINKAVSLLDEQMTETEYKEALNHYLSFEIDSSTRLRKTREILMNIWFYDSDEITPVRNKAKEIITKYPEYAVPIHLCMMYIAYPVVADVGKHMGRLFEFQDEISNTVLRQKLYDEWGERGTLQTTNRRITLTMKELGILDCVSKTRYKLKKQSISKNDVINFIIYVAMMVGDQSYYSFTDLTAFDVLFPFEYKVSKEALMEDERFVVTKFGSEISVALRTS